MKKILPALLLLLISNLSYSATITIGDPTIGAVGGFFHNDMVSDQERTDYIRINTRPFYGQSPAQTITFTSFWTISSTHDVDITLNISTNNRPNEFTNMSNWSTSILDMDNNILSTEPVGESHSISLSSDENLRVRLLGQIVRSDSPTFVATLSFSEDIGEVPLPAAVWLFGSILLGGLVMRRKAIQVKPSGK